MLRRLLNRLAYRAAYRREYARQMRNVEAILGDDALRAALLTRLDTTAASAVVEAADSR